MHQLLSQMARLQAENLQLKSQVPWAATRTILAVTLCCNVCACHAAIWRSGHRQAGSQGTASSCTRTGSTCRPPGEGKRGGGEVPGAEGHRCCQCYDEGWRTSGQRSNGGSVAGTGVPSTTSWVRRSASFTSPGPGRATRSACSDCRRWEGKEEG